MKTTFRNIAFTALLTLGAFSAITVTSCNKDECEDVVCQNGGTCSDGNCTCPTGYEGANCQTASRDKFVGTYIGNETCTVGSDSYTLTIASNTSSGLSVTISNIYGVGYSATGAVTSANVVTFTGSQSGATFSGTATLNGNTVTMAYTISDVTSTNTCTFIGTK